MQKHYFGLSVPHLVALVGLFVLGSVAAGSLAVWLFVFGGGSAFNTVEVVTATFAQTGTSPSPVAAASSLAAPSEAAAAQPATGPGSQSLIGRWTLLPPPTPSGPVPTPVVQFAGIPVPTITPGGPPTPVPPTPRASPTPIGPPLVIDLCAIAFGNSLEFFPDGTYAGTAGTWLPGGSYSVQPGDRVKLATAKGGISVFPFSIVGDVLTVQASGATVQCTLRYRREP